MTALMVQRTPTDCGICCLAMALDLDYDFVRRKVAEEDEETFVAKGMSNEMYHRIFEGLGLKNDLDYAHLQYSPHYGTLRYTKNIMWGRRAICSVLSRNYQDGWHFIFWDGFKIHDPSPKLQYTDWANDCEPKDYWLFNESDRKTVFR